MSERVTWTRFHHLVALGLYCEMPSSKFDKRQPRIIDAATTLGRTPSSLAMKLSNLASLDPVFIRSGRKGFGNSSKADRALWHEFTEQPTRLMEEMAQALMSLDELGTTNNTTEDQELTEFHGESIATTAKRRKGQSLFRTSVLSAYGYQCCITGIADQRLLVASHIKPWAQDAKNRLNPSNGLCLSTFYDRAFDIGLISFDDKHQLLVSPELAKQKDNAHIRETFLERTGTAIQLPFKFLPSPSFLRWHRKSLFIL